MQNDPLFDALSQWLKDGASLEGVGAIAALGAILRFFVVPLVEAAITKFLGVQFTSVYKLQMISLCGVGTTAIFGVLTGSTTPFNQQVLIGLLASMTAIGIHQATDKAKQASEALAAQSTSADSSK